MRLKFARGSNSAILNATGSGSSQLCKAAGRSAALFCNEHLAAQHESISARGGGSAIGDTALLVLASPDTSTLFCNSSAQPLTCGAAQGLVKPFRQLALACTTQRCAASSSFGRAWSIRSSMRPRSLDAPAALAGESQRE